MASTGTRAGLWELTRHYFLPEGPHLASIRLSFYLHNVN